MLPAIILQLESLSELHNEIFLPIFPCNTIVINSLIKRFIMNSLIASPKTTKSELPLRIKANKPVNEIVRKRLLICGILSSVLYVTINIFVPMLLKGYSYAAQTISELSAIGAPTRTLWMVLSTPYTLLMIAFAWGVWKSAGRNRLLRIAGGLLMAYGALGILWPFAPMHLRETLAAGGGTFSDTMHITLGAVTEIFYLFALGFAAAALGKQFRLYSIATFVVLLVFGVLTFLDAPGIAKNQPTPLIGVWERINIGVFLLWVVVLAVVLLRTKDEGDSIKGREQNYKPIAKN